MRKFTFIPVLPLLLLTATAWGQQGAFPGANPAPREPLEIYEPFFHFHADLDARLQATKSRAPARAQALDNAAARHLGVSTAEWNGLAVVARDSVARLTSLNTEVRSQPAVQNVPLAVRQRFQQRRQEVLEDGLRRMKAGVSPKSWANLKSYIESRFGQNISKLEPGRPMQK
ncbi:MAG: hypothetical protein IT168_24280 [Bryobacterales bacterium]|nr:hypothetical protein [Bryobacterales bacterium]